MKPILAFFVLLWITACSSIGTQSFGDAPPIRVKLAYDLEHIGGEARKGQSSKAEASEGGPGEAGATTHRTDVSVDGRTQDDDARLKQYIELYEKASASTGEAERTARNKLTQMLVIRIQNYHEVMNNDIFVNTVVYSSALDIITVVAAAVATAVSPANTKTWWAAVATTSAGAKLALSRNVLQEKSANLILSTMISERAAKLSAIKTHMNLFTDKYSVEEAVIDLNDFFNTGSLDKSAATAEANATTQAESKRKDAKKNAEESDKAR